MANKISKEGLATITSIFKQISLQSLVWHLPLWLLMGVHPAGGEGLTTIEIPSHRDNLLESWYNWEIEQSFQAAYVSWDTIEGFSPKSLKLERNFDDDNDLDVFYRWSNEFKNEFKTGNLEHEIAFTLETEKNLFNLARQTPTNNFNSERSHPPFSTSDFLRQGGSLDLGLEYGLTLGGGFSLYVEGGIELEIPEATATPDFVTFNLKEDEGFAPEFSLYYEPSPSLYFYATYSGSRKSVSGLDFEGNALRPHTENNWEFGLESQVFNNKMLAGLYFNFETQRNVTATDLDFQFQIDKQRSRSVWLTVEGEIAPRWNLSAYYTYQYARIINDDRAIAGNNIPDIAAHEAAIWSTYEMQSGFGFGGGLTFKSDRPANIQNTTILPSYLQTDLVLFYRNSNYQAALNLQNLFNANNSDSQPFSILGTLQISF